MCICSPGKYTGLEDVEVHSYCTTIATAATAAAPLTAMRLSR